MANNTYTKGYLNGAALTESQLDTAYQTLQLDISNTPLLTTGSSDGQVLTSTGSGTAAAFETIPDPQGPFSLRNYGLKATVASGVMTVSLTTKAGTAPSGSDKVDFNYSTNGTTSATYSTVQISSATTLTVNASATLGYIPTSSFRVFVYGYYSTSASAVKLAVSGMATFDCGASLTTVSIGAAADNNALYASAALSIVPRLLGWIDTSHSSAGAWQTPTKVNIVNSYPGRAVAISASSGSASTTSTAASTVTNMSLTISTSGRPIYLGIIGDGSGSATSLAVSGVSAATKAAFYSFYRGTSALGIQSVSGGWPSAASANQVTIPTSALQHIDIPSAGTHTYTVKFFSTGGVTANLANSKFIAYEL